MNSAKNLTQKEVLHLTRLANVELTQDEVTTYQKQLGEILNYVDELKEVDVKSLKETSYTVDSNNVDFEDGTKCTRLLEELKNLNLEKKDGKNYFVVKRIL